LPPGRVIARLVPADLPKDGAHFDLPIALALMAAIGAAPQDALEYGIAFGEQTLDGAPAATAVVLPAAMAAQDASLCFNRRAAFGAEAAWADCRALAAPGLIAPANPFPQRPGLGRAAARPPDSAPAGLDTANVHGQEIAKRAVEIAAGGQNLLLVGQPCSGKSMLASRVPRLLPPLAPDKLLELSMVMSVAGLLERGLLTRT